jgi:hypothetical protein
MFASFIARSQRSAEFSHSLLKLAASFKEGLAMSRHRSKQTRTRLPRRQHRRAADQQIQNDVANQKLIEYVVTLLKNLKAQLEPLTA